MASKITQHSWITNSADEDQTPPEDAVEPGQSLSHQKILRHPHLTLTTPLRSTTHPSTPSPPHQHLTYKTRQDSHTQVVHSQYRPPLIIRQVHPPTTHPPTFVQTGPPPNHHHPCHPSSVRHRHHTPHHYSTHLHTHSNNLPTNMRHTT